MIITFCFLQFPSHRFKYLAMECEVNKFSRCRVSVHIKSQNLRDIQSGSTLGDVQIFKDEFGRTQVLSEIGPFIKKLIFKTKFPAHQQLSYSWQYSVIPTTLNDITEYIKSSNTMMQEVCSVYL